jgi:hypothetical protein
VAAGSRPVAWWDYGVECRRGHGCLSLVNIVRCQVNLSASSRSVVQRSSTDCGVPVCVISKSQQWGGFGPSTVVAPQVKQNIIKEMYLLGESVKESIGFNWFRINQVRFVEHGSFRLLSNTNKCTNYIICYLKSVLIIDIKTLSYFHSSYMFRHITCHPQGVLMFLAKITGKTICKTW